MLKFCGIHPLRYGDIVMNLVSAKILKEQYPDSHFTLVINNNYKDIAPIFIDNPYIDRIHILHKDKDGFDEIDLEWVKNQAFDHVFNPMADHDHSKPWFLFRHQTLETAFVHEIISQDDINRNVYNPQIELTKWFDVGKDLNNFVAFMPFAGQYDPNNSKRLLANRAQIIVDYIRDYGFNVLQLGGKDDPKLQGSLFFNTNYFESVKNMLGCKFLITTDSGLNWVASGYQFPTIGLYSNEYYGKEYIKNIQPINSNATYLDDNNVNHIDINLVFNTILEKINKNNQS